MHLLQTYALLSGAKINQCYIYEEKIDIPYREYIVFHPECSKAKARQYKKWSHVIELITNDSDITAQIIQIGSLIDKKYSKVDTNYLGKTNVHQLAYIIKECSLFLGYDSFPMHLASYYDKKIVSLFAYYAKNSGPYFSSNHNTILLEPNFEQHKPSFSYDDNYDLINTIAPETIYQGIKKIYDNKE